MAGEFFSGAASNAIGTLMVDYLVKPIERRLRYLFRFHKLIDDLHQQQNNLNREQTRVEEDVKEAKLQIQTQVIEDYIGEWLTNVENALKDVQNLDSRVEENKRCFSLCPNWCWRYQLGKEIEKKIVYISKLVEDSHFKRIGHRAELPGLEFFTSKDILASKSSTNAFNKIREALEDDKVNMIGVWGMGGVGKTTLVKEVGKKTKESGCFRKVIEVVVSQNSIIENIQDKIADFLDSQFEKKTKEGRAGELWLQLEKEEKVLIILDDMWNEVHLKEIGIPLNENGKGCKIILTTRRKTVCESMECQVIIPMDVLESDEAWALFRMKAKLNERVPRDILQEAQKVAKECKGLPVAIVTLAAALKSTKTSKGWEVAGKKLERSKLVEIGNIGEEEKNAYLCIKMSYEYLKKETNKKCFFLCGLYPEDHSIKVEDLVRYAWGLELFGKADLIGEVRIQVLEAIDYLKDSCLLLEDEVEDEDGDGGRYVKLHDIVRDVTLWIASEEKSDFMIKSRLELLNKSSESCEGISLLDSEEKNFPDRLILSKLEILLLKNCNV
ncbi:disease resistance protein At4g27190-like [Gossypium arboreum]|uniref:disease resistance protein At4g27190-like n=1 Tax=Gossypium arboreum TaxID=29729 RepID=UPI0022F1700E|nr:disease resistance protein At4g27190-like [Gossypium arboreum]XP_052881082.1 disease resistance protein At4g27190-like [Gossypium arboreum]